MRFSRAAALFLGTGRDGRCAELTTWSYEGRTGPLRWGKLDPSYQACSNAATSNRPSTFAART